MAERILKGNGFILRHFRITDTDSVAKHANDESIGRNTANIPYPYTKQDAQSWISRKLGEYDNPESGDEVFAVDVEGEAVGSIGLHKIERNHKAEIGYWLSKEHRGKGIMSQAVQLVTDYGFKRYNLIRIQAFVFLFNGASAKVLEKNGYKEEGVLRKYYIKDKKPIDAVLYSKINL